MEHSEPAFRSWRLRAQFLHSSTMDQPQSLTSPGSSEQKCTNSEKQSIPRGESTGHCFRLPANTIYIRDSMASLSHIKRQSIVATSTKSLSSVFWWYM